MERENSLPRSSSLSSSDGSSTVEDWILLNATGSEIESCSCQTEPSHSDLYPDTLANSVESVSATCEQCLVKEDTLNGSDGTLASSDTETCESYEIMSAGCSEGEEISRDSESELQELQCQQEMESSLAASSSTVCCEERASLVVDVLPDLPERRKFSDSDDNVNSNSDLSLLEELELTEQIRERRFKVDVEKVSRLLDTLAKSVENKPATPLESSAETSAEGSYCDDLPVNFVHMCKSRIRNYIHTANTHLNWRLTFLMIIVTATVLGFALGHFLGTTHLWLNGQDAQQQDKQMKVMEDGLVSCLQKLENNEDFRGEMAELRRQLSGCRQLQSYCSVYDKPSCPESSESRIISDCEAAVLACKNKLEAVESEIVRKTTVNGWAEKRIRQLEKNVTILSRRANGYSAAVLIQRRAERLSSTLQKRLRRKDESIEALEEKLQAVKSQILGLAGGNRALREENDRLNMNNAWLQRQLFLYATKEGERAKEASEQRRATTEEGKNNERTENFSWENLYTLGSGNLTERIKAYLSSVNHVAISRYAQQLLNSGAHLSQEQWHQLQNLVSHVQELVKKKLKELGKVPPSAAFDEYIDRAQVFGEKVKDYLNDLNEQLNDEAKHIAKDFISPKVQTVWATLSHHLQDILSPASGQKEENKNTKENLGEVDEEIFADDDISEEELQRSSTSVPELALKEVSCKETAEDMRKFRYALKGSSFDEEIGEEMAERYYDYLKSLGKRYGCARGNWWKCQKLWWMGKEGAVSRNCLGELWRWQRQYQFLPEVLVNKNNMLKKCVISWQQNQQNSGSVSNENTDDESKTDVKNPEGPWLSGSSEKQAIRDENGKAEWFFDRSRARSRLRKEQDDGYKQSEWTFRRAKERAKRRSESKRSGNDCHHDSDDDDDDDDGAFDCVHGKMKGFEHKSKKIHYWHAEGNRQNYNHGHNKDKYQQHKKHAKYQRNSEKGFWQAGASGFFHW